MSAAMSNRYEDDIVTTLARAASGLATALHRRTMDDSFPAALDYIEANLRHARDLHARRIRKVQS